MRRRVALKVLKLGMDSRVILARFAREQASLARINHDAVAKIFDAGRTPQGQSFFAMELVEGRSITEQSPDAATFADVGTHGGAPSVRGGS